MTHNQTPGFLSTNVPGNTFHRAEDIGLAPIDLTRATPPVTEELNAALKWSLQNLSRLSRLDLLVRSNNIGGDDRSIWLAATWLTPRLGRRPPQDHVVIGNGTQNLLSMVLRTTCGKSGVLMAEKLTHPLVPPIAADLGISVVPVDIDADGIVPEAYDEACRRVPYAPLYCNPTGHNPTAHVMPLARREQIVAIARRYDRDIIEDDVLGSLRGAGGLPPIGAIAPDVTWYLQTLSKCVGLGLRLAYLVTPERISRDKILGPLNMRSSWFPGVIPLELANQLFEYDRFSAVAQSMATVAERRRCLLLEALDSYHPVTAQGALHAWLRLEPPWTSQTFADVCVQGGVRVRPSHLFRANADLACEGEEPAIRIALTAPETDAEFITGIHRLRNCLDHPKPQY